MFGKRYVHEMISRSAENGTDRRRFLTSAGAAGLGAVGAGLIGAPTAMAGESESECDSNGPSDAAILNFALNLEYLEAEFYLHAVFGEGLEERMATGRCSMGKVVGGSEVPFKTPKIKQYAREIATDELDHVVFLRNALGSAKVARPKIDLQESFTAAARAAGLIDERETFNPFADENSFLLAAFLFEDVGVTAYKGAAPLIDNKNYLEAAAGILAVEAYHASNIRTVLYERELAEPAQAISDARDNLDGRTNLDQGIVRDGYANIVPANDAGIAFSRTAGQVLNIVYLTSDKASSGGFFPNGVNGVLDTSAPQP